MGFSIAHYIEVFSVDEVVSIYNDTFDWTKNKIVGNNSNALIIKGGGNFKTLDEILNETSDSHHEESKLEVLEEGWETLEEESTKKEDL